MFPPIYPPPPASAAWCVDADANANGAINVADVQFAILYALDPELTCTIGDINGDGECDVSDVQRVISAIYVCPDTAAWYFAFWDCVDTCDWSRVRTPVGSGDSTYIGHGWVIENAGPGCNLSAWTTNGANIFAGDHYWVSGDNWAMEWSEYASGADGCAVEVSW